MSPSGKGLGLAVVCLGVVTATAVWKYAASEGQQPSTGTAGVKPRSTMEADEVRESERLGILIGCHMCSSAGPGCLFSCLKIVENQPRNYNFAEPLDR